jgi:hypothetical protein
VESTYYLDWGQVEHAVEATLEERNFEECCLVEEEEASVLVVDNLSLSTLVEE